jgi:hypothetical protein
MLICFALLESHAIRSTESLYVGFLLDHAKHPRIASWAELRCRASEGTHLYRLIQPDDHLVLNYRQPARIDVR